METLAYQDWAPYSYLDGFHGDQSTRGNVNDRAVAVSNGDSRYLEVKLPEGCVTSMCAMQAKSHLLLPVDSATLKFKCGFHRMTSAVLLDTACLCVHNSRSGIVCGLLQDAIWAEL